MTPLLAATLTILSIGMFACTSPGRVIRPVIYTDNDQAAAAMRSAPLIVMGRIGDLTLPGDAKNVAKPPEVGGPRAPTIPLHLARINAEVLLTVRGRARSAIDFYSWIWASGKHGGARLFHPNPGGIRVLFLREEGGYLHTVGDYPSYDLEFRSSWVPALLAGWKSGQNGDAAAIDRLIALRLRAELEGLSARQLREDFGPQGPRVNHYWALGLRDLVRVAGPFFLASQLDDICRHSSNPSVRFAACYLTNEHFLGRCEAFRQAQKAMTDAFVGELLPKLLRSCEARDRELIGDLRSGAPLTDFFPWSPTQRHLREAMRVYASAFDPEVHEAACEAAAKMPEVRDIPECSGRR